MCGYTVYSIVKSRKKRNKKTSKKVLTKRETGAIIIRLSRERPQTEPRTALPEKTFEKSLKKVLTLRTQCDILIRLHQEREAKNLEN